MRGPSYTARREVPNRTADLAPEYNLDVLGAKSQYLESRASCFGLTDWERRRSIFDRSAPQRLSSNGLPLPRAPILTPRIRLPSEGATQLNPDLLVLSHYNGRDRT